MDYPNGTILEIVCTNCLTELIPGIQSDEQFAKQLFYAPFAVVSHKNDESNTLNQRFGKKSGKCLRISATLCVAILLSNS